VDFSTSLESPKGLLMGSTNKCRETNAKLE